MLDPNSNRSHINSNTSFKSISDLGNHIAIDLIFAFWHLQCNSFIMIYFFPFRCDWFVIWFSLD
ncbi:hypothetical protein HanIR_Chr04g0161121 [Helianthus annuus]|nr:hypothetical protein HanIR_Chr04g0161121 [Helianthus annuus]